MTDFMSLLTVSTCELYSSHTQSGLKLYLLYLYYILFPTLCLVICTTLNLKFVKILIYITYIHSLAASLGTPYE